MANLIKCDVKDCEDVIVGDEAEGTVEFKDGEGVYASKDMCKRHSDALRDSYFPAPKAEIPAPAAAPAPAEGTPPSTT